jgi:hypothetical protein
MDDFNSETDSDYTSYWRDWVGLTFVHQQVLGAPWNEYGIYFEEYRRELRLKFAV